MSEKMSTQQNTDNEQHETSINRTTQTRRVLDRNDPQTPQQTASASNSATTATANNNNTSPSGSSTESEEVVLKYGAKHVIMLFVPVSLCMLLVVVSLKTITSYQSGNGQQLIYTPFTESSSNTAATNLWMSLANAGIMIGVVIVMTIVLIILYKYRCYKILQGWLALSSLLLLFLFTYMYISEFIRTFNIVADFITIAILMWNFGVIGMVCIHWMGPLRLQQCYLIIVCTQMALIFVKYLPDWTTWVLLAFISIWDLVAVLCPFGPLRILVETAKSRDDKLFPALIYSSTIVYTLMANVDDLNGDSSSKQNTSEPTATRNSLLQSEDDEDEAGFNREENTRDRRELRQRNTNQQSENSDAVAVRVVSRESERPSNTENSEEEEENGIKLGLGDFIFYSVLVGKAAVLGDLNTVIACFVAILIGLCFTLVLLAIFHKALPALPISLTFGLIFYFCTNLVVRPFYDGLTSRQYFI